jgi:uncharacterized protein YecE (DUF72 family)
LRPFNVGCSGWFYWHWRRTFYPPALPTNQWFEHYAKYFKTVELNAPFYSWPTIAAVRAWVRQTGRGKFVFTVKASELITHVKRLTGTRPLIRDFGHIADLLGPKMGCFLFQLPPSFHYSHAYAPLAWTALIPNVCFMPDSCRMLSGRSGFLPIAHQIAQLENDRIGDRVVGV